MRTKVLDELIKSSIKTNPFRSKSSSALEITLRAAIDIVLPKINEQDWAQIREALKELKSYYHSETRTREEAIEDTSFVLDPKVVATQKTGGWVRSSPTWQVIGDRVFVSVGSNDGHLYVTQLFSKQSRTGGAK